MARKLVFAGSPKRDCARLQLLEVAWLDLILTQLDYGSKTFHIPVSFMGLKKSWTAT
jgi:hypothetical protein